MSWNQLPYLGHTAISSLRKPSMKACGDYPREESCEREVDDPEGGTRICGNTYTKSAPNQKPFCKSCREELEATVWKEKKANFQRKYAKEIKDGKRTVRPWKRGKGY